MRSKTPPRTWYLSLLTLALLAPPSTDSAKRRAKITRRRRAVPSIPSPSSKLLHVNSEERLRERWVEVLSLEHDSSNSIRLENRQEQRYYYEAELLADKLLGIEESVCDEPQTDLLRNDNSLLSVELSIIWKSVAVASSMMLIAIPAASVINAIIASHAVQNLLSVMQSTITPYLVPTASIISTSLRNYRLQAQAILHSAPYLLRHLHHIKFKPLPFLYKLIRKCIIVEAWRHVWVRVYKLTRYLWRGTLSNARSAYDRFTPAWIRRGIKSYFQGMVQAQVHGAVGGVVGAVWGGMTSDSWAWSSGSGGGDGASSGGVNSEGLDAVQESVSDAVAEVATDSAAQGLESAVENVIDSVTDDGAVMDTISENVGSVVEDAAEFVAEGAMDAVAEGVDASVESAMESLIDDCLTEGCVDQAMESVME